jgi:hypothetical protein
MRWRFSSTDRQYGEVHVPVIIGGGYPDHRLGLAVAAISQLIWGRWSQPREKGTHTARRPCTRPWRGVGTRRAIP